MAFSKVISLMMSAMLLGFALAQSPSGAPSPSPIFGIPAASPLAQPPNLASPSPSPAPTAFTAPPPTSSSPSPSPSPAAFFSPPSPPPSTGSPSPSVSVAPTAGDAPLSSPNSAVINGAGLAAAAVGFFAVLLVA